MLTIFVGLDVLGFDDAQHTPHDASQRGTQVPRTTTIGTISYCLRIAGVQPQKPVDHSSVQLEAMGNLVSQAVQELQTWHENRVEWVAKHVCDCHFLRPGQPLHRYVVLVIRTKGYVLRQHEFNEQVGLENEKIQPRARRETRAKESPELGPQLGETGETFLRTNVAAFPRTVRAA